VLLTWNVRVCVWWVVSVFVVVIVIWSVRAAPVKLPQVNLSSTEVASAAVLDYT
jgi:hypothetical protein